ncbi:MAG TPA: hypothetical protein VLM43_17335 [Desulfobacterales bacterium]|nr:hypothetical protein [Desulfobacterales bacterium]
MSFIEWEKVFLIAGMLPLRAALDKFGTLGAFGPYAVLFGLLVLFN